MTNDSASTSSSTEGSIRWSEDDAYAIAMGKPEHSGRVRGVPGQLPRKSTSHSFTRSSSEQSQVPALLGEIDMLKELLMAQQEWFQAHVKQYESQQQLIQKQQNDIQKQQNDIVQMQKMLEVIMANTRTSSQFSVPDIESPDHVNARSSVASRLGNSLNFTIMR
jgi:hypothetical protein